MNGYIEAAKIDHLINQLVQKQPITEDNAREWLAFTRTVESTCMVLRMEVKLLLGLKEVEVG
jgi:hypothetical protein